MKSPVAPLTIAFSLVLVTACGNGSFGSTNDSGSVVSLSANDLNRSAGGSASGKVSTKSGEAAAADAETKKECDAAQAAQTTVTF